VSRSETGGMLPFLLPQRDYADGCCWLMFLFHPAERAAGEYNYHSSEARRWLLAAMRRTKRFKRQLRGRIRQSV
jgi:hypothetical protein